MKNIVILENFCAELMAGRAKTESFEAICTRIGETCMRVDACLREALGVGGETVTECFRNDIPACLVAGAFASEDQDDMA